MGSKKSQRQSILGSSIGINRNSKSDHASNLSMDVNNIVQNDELWRDFKDSLKETKLTTAVGVKMYLHKFCNEKRISSSHSLPATNDVESFNDSISAFSENFLGNVTRKMKGIAKRSSSGDLSVGGRSRSNSLAEDNNMCARSFTGQSKDQSKNPLKRISMSLSSEAIPGLIAFDAAGGSVSGESEDCSLDDSSHSYHKRASFFSKRSSRQSNSSMSRDAKIVSNVPDDDGSESNSMSRRYSNSSFGLSSVGGELEDLIEEMENEDDSSMESSECFGRNEQTATEEINNRTRITRRSGMAFVPL